MLFEKCKMISSKQEDDFMKGIKYPSYVKSGDCDEYYNICLKFICKDFEKKHEIEKIGMLIHQRGGSNAMQSCMKKLEALVSNEAKKRDLNEKEVVSKVMKTVSMLWKPTSKRSF